VIKIVPCNFHYFKGVNGNIGSIDLIWQKTA